MATEYNKKEVKFLKSKGWELWKNAVHLHNEELCPDFDHTVFRKVKDIPYHRADVWVKDDLFMYEIEEALEHEEYEETQVD